jgi:hypothetical protein
MSEARDAEQRDSVAPPSGDGPKDGAEARARLYLDLWERNLARLALQGPVRGEATRL